MSIWYLNLSKCVHNLLYSCREQTTQLMTLEQKGDLPQQCCLMCRCQCGRHMQRHMTWNILNLTYFVGQNMSSLFVYWTGTSGHCFSVFHVNFSRLSSLCGQTTRKFRGGVSARKQNTTTLKKKKLKINKDAPLHPGGWVKQHLKHSFTHQRFSVSVLVHDAKTLVS